MFASRLFIGVILALGVCISAFHRRRADASSSRVSWQKEGVPMILALRGTGLMLWGALALHIVAPQLLSFTYLEVPWYVRVMGAALALSMIPALAWMFASLGDNITPTVELRPEHTLVTTGPYRWIRHPLYTFGMTLFASLGVVAGSWWILAWTVAGFTLLRIRLSREEEELHSRFGLAYETWSQETPRFLPKVFR